MQWLPAADDPDTAGVNHALGCYIPARASGIGSSVCVGSSALRQKCRRVCLASSMEPKFTACAISDQAYLRCSCMHCNQPQALAVLATAKERARMKEAMWLVRIGYCECRISCLLVISLQRRKHMCCSGVRTLKSAGTAGDECNESHGRLHNSHEHSWHVHLLHGCRAHSCGQRKTRRTRR